MSPRKERQHRIPPYRAAAFLLLAAALILPFASASICDQAEAGNIVSYWSMDGIVTDELGNYDFTNSGATNSSTALIGGAWDFESTESDHMYIGSDITENVNTYCFGFNPDSTLTIVGGENARFCSDNNDDPGSVAFGAVSGSFTDELVSWLASGTTIYHYWKDSDLSMNQFTAGTYYYMCFVWSAGDTKYRLYIDGSDEGLPPQSGGTMPLLTNYDIDLGRRQDVYFNGQIDEVLVSNVSFTATEISQLYANISAGNQYNDWNTCAGSPAPGSFPWVKIKVQDAYDGSVIQYANVTLSDGLSNLTNAAGMAVFNHSGNVAYNVSDPVYDRYFSRDSPSNAGENTTTVINITGAFPTFNASNLAGVYLQNFTACSPSYCNYTASSTTKLLLPPNSTINITIIGYDGNHTAAINDTNQTYFNKTYELTTTGKDTKLYNISGLYQNEITINVSLGYTASYLSNFTINLTGPVNYSGVFTSNYTTTHQLIAGDYLIEVDPVGYSLNNKSITLAMRNYSSWVTVPVFALNSFYLNIRDELNRELITDAMSIEIISDLSAGNYTTTNGTYIFELLTPTDYTLRWKGSNWPERDYYQTLINQNYYNINLYSLTAGNASTLLVTVVDTTGEPLSGATVQLRRYFVYCNCYEVVEMAQTSFSGEAYLNVDAYDGHYKLAVTYGGRTLLTDSPENYIPTVSGVAITRTITFNTGSDYYESYAALPNIARSLVYNDATGAFSFSWADPSGLVEYGCFVVEYANTTRYEEISTCQNGSNGNIIYSLPDKDNTTYRYYAHIETSTNYSDYVVFAGYKDKDPAINFGAAGYFLGGLIIILFGLVGAVIGAIAGLVFTALSLVMVIAMGLLPLGWGVATGVITMIAGLGIFLMRR